MKKVLKEVIYPSPNFNEEIFKLTFQSRQNLKSACMKGFIEEQAKKTKKLQELNFTPQNVNFQKKERTKFDLTTIFIESYLLILSNLRIFNPDQTHSKKIKFNMRGTVLIVKLQ